MTQAKSQEVALSFVAKINAHDVEGLAALMSPDHAFIDGLGTVTRGADRMRRAWQGYFAWFPDYSIEVTQHFSRGGDIALFGTARGTFAVNGRLEEQDSWQVPAAWRAVIRDGRVTEWQVYCDNDRARKIMAGNSARESKS
jgi:ketosteroid isomerase-like protein